MVKRLDQGSAHRPGGPQGVFFFQQAGGAVQVLAAHGGYFQLPEHHGWRILGKHGFHDWVHATRNSSKTAQFV